MTPPSSRVSHKQLPSAVPDFPKVALARRFWPLWARATVGWQWQLRWAEYLMLNELVACHRMIPVA
eukprot:4072563-Alexandrium_andersonii.AAC.2